MPLYVCVELAALIDVLDGLLILQHRLIEQAKEAANSEQYSEATVLEALLAFRTVNWKIESIMAHTV